MRKIKLAGLMFAATLAVSVTTAAAASATLWTVSSGNHSGVLTATSGKIVFKDGMTTLNCESSTLKGSIKEGKGLSESVGKITSGTWDENEETCSGPFGIEFGVTQSGEWTLSATGYTSGITTGKITGISVSATGLCKFKIEGEVGTSYANGTLAIASSKLTFSGVTGLCFGAIKNGDSVSASGSYSVSNPTVLEMWPTEEPESSLWKVKSDNGNGLLTGASGEFDVVHGSTTVIRCPESTLSGTINEGSGVDGEHLATITEGSFAKGSETCSIGPFNAGATHVGSWYVNALSESSNVVTTDIKHVNIAVSGGGCSATISGELTGVKYRNATNLLALEESPGLEVSGVGGGCFGIVKNGDHVTITTGYSITFPSGLEVAEI